MNKLYNDIRREAALQVGGKNDKQNSSILSVNYTIYAEK